MKDTDAGQKSMRLVRLILLALGCIGCRQPTVHDLLAGSGAQSGIRKVETAQHLFMVRYVPTAMLLLSRAGLNGEAFVTQDLLDSLRKQEDVPDGWTFVLTVSLRTPLQPGSMENDVIYGSRSGFGSYQEALAAFQFGLREKVWIEYEGKKIPLGNYQMENTFGMSPSRNFTLMFPDPGADSVRKVRLVLDEIVPGMLREKLEFEIQPERYAISR